MFNKVMISKIINNSNLKKKIFKYLNFSYDRYLMMYIIIHDKSPKSFKNKCIVRVCFTKIKKKSWFFKHL